MISIIKLFEIQKKLPWRKRAEVYILKDDKLIVGKSTNKKWKGYIIPGGGIDKNETPIQAAKRETLEEIGVSCKSFKKINETRAKYGSDIPSTMSNKMKEYLKKVHSKYIGTITYTFIAHFDKYDKKLWGKEIDKYQPIEVDIDTLISFFKKEYQKMKNKHDSYNFEKIKYILENLKLIKNGRFK